MKTIKSRFLAIVTVFILMLAGTWPTSGTKGFFLTAAHAQDFTASGGEHRTYLVNGLASVMPFVGYGFNNLKQKLRHAKLYSYATPVEGSIVVLPSVLSDIRREYRANPGVKINLIGISYGGNIVTSLASQLAKDGIPVNYLGVLDGPMLAPVPANVHRVDNFVCRYVGCIGQKVRLAKGNNTTLRTEFTFASTHIGLGDNSEVHRRIVRQLTEIPLLIAGRPIETIDMMATASVQ